VKLGRRLALTIAAGFLGVVVLSAAVGIASPNSTGTSANSQLERKWLTKDELLQRDEQIRAAALRAPRPPQPRNATFPPPEKPEFALGILELHQSIFPPAVYLIENQWWGRLRGQPVGVYAGSVTADPRQGLVILVRPNPEDPGLSYLEPPSVYRTQEWNGALRITGATGNILAIASAEGATYTFDVSSRTLARR